MIFGKFFSIHWMAENYNLILKSTEIKRSREWRPLNLATSTTVIYGEGMTSTACVLEKCAKQILSLHVGVWSVIFYGLLDFAGLTMSTLFCHAQIPYAFHNQHNHVYHMQVERLKTFF